MKIGFLSIVDGFLVQYLVVNDLCGREKKISPLNIVMSLSCYHEMSDD